MLIYLLALAVVLVAALVAYGAAAMLHLHGAPLFVLATLIVLAGIVAAVTILVIHFRARKRQGEGEGVGGDGDHELDVLLNDANRKLRTAQRQGRKSLDGLPLIYLLGEAGSAKTTTVLRSGLDPELLAGTAPPEADVSPTPLLNLWFTRQAAIVEAGQAIRENTGLLNRLITRTRPKAYRSIAPARAVVVCVSVEQFLVPDAPTSSLASARTIGSQLRQISRLLGAALPVYVIVTKLDRVPHFAEYVRNLSNDEVRQVLGAVLPRNDASAGLYADKVLRELGMALDALVFTLAEFRVEMLSRETEPKNAPGVYEFPREFGKLRKNLSQYLVELCKPSQLSANPYLRGFYFVGLRAQMVEQIVGPAPTPVQSAAPDVGATVIFSRQELQAPRAPAQPLRLSSRAPQWTFLSRLFPDIVLGDRSALSATQQTAPARLFRRSLFASLAAIFAIYTILLAVSYLNNSALESKLLAAARALPMVSSSATPSLSDLQAMDQLRLTILQLDGYQKNGPPLSYRFGLYQGDKLAARARKIYFDRFRPMLLNTAQANILSYLGRLPNTPAPGADYTAAYDPLKAYLMTTSNPDRTVPQFLTPVLLQYWLKSAPADRAQSLLARQQIDFYAGELLKQDPYTISPDSVAVDHARTYLSNFGAVPRIYQDMLTAAEKASPGIDFNKQYANSASSVIEPHFVPGAFTRSGFAFMQDAIRHPDRYFQGETWVLGQQAARSLDSASVSRQLTAIYSGEFIRQWHAFLTEAHIIGCGSLKDAPEKLNTLAGPESPLLEFFYTVSSNTAVADPQIKTIFQPAQVLVDPNATSRFIGGGNTNYVNALLSLSGAVNQFNQKPDTSADQLNAAVSAADLAVQQTAQAFNVDPQMHTEKTVISLLGAPIRCAIPPPPPPPPGPPSATCTLLGKFPFAGLSKSQANRDLTNNEQASLQEVNTLFAPGTGKVWTYYNDSLKPWLGLEGARYVLAPNAAGHVGPLFAQFFNRLAAISAMLYPSGASNAAFNFTLRSVPSKGIENATLVVDGQRIAPGSTVQQFKWNGATAHQASLAYNAAEALQFQGTWALFQLVGVAHVTRTAGGIELEFPLEVSGHPLRLPDGTPEVVRFELSGPGADILAPGGLNGLPCVPSVTK
ncbi:MAG TPA: ImcF-related family protein [Acidobacteriaceae bacterium]|nr:ImcF-related family protein [Acidobacteriaceae bacterium]